MLRFDQLLWTSEVLPPVQVPAQVQECIFLFDPVLGLADLDFHRITEDGWRNMKSPHPGTPAKLIIPPGTTCKELQEAIQLIESKGGYHSVLITISEPEGKRKNAG